VDAVGAQTVADEPTQELVLLGDLGDALQWNPLTTAGAGRRLRPHDSCGGDVEALGTPVLVVGALTPLNRPEAHGVEPTLDCGAGEEPGTMLEAELGPQFGIEVAASLYSSGGFLARSR
jgi:hypothetical protein